MDFTQLILPCLKWVKWHINGLKSIRTGLYFFLMGKIEYYGNGRWLNPGLRKIIKMAVIAPNCVLYNCNIPYILKTKELRGLAL